MGGGAGGATASFGLGVWKEDMTLALVGFVLLFARSLNNSFGSARYAKLFHSIFNKYEAKMKELAKRHHAE